MSNTSSRPYFVRDGIQCRFEDDGRKNADRLRRAWYRRRSQEEHPYEVQDRDRECPLPRQMILKWAERHLSVGSFWKRDIRYDRPCSRWGERRLSIRRAALFRREEVKVKLSARNQLKGKIVAVTKGQTTAHVRIDIGGGVIVTSSITNEAVDDLALKVGDDAFAVVKASDVMVAK
jgi:molybdopterin-binding protein